MRCPQAFSPGQPVRAAQPLTEPRQEFISRPDDFLAGADQVNPGYQSRPNADNRSRSLTRARHRSPAS